MAVVELVCENEDDFEDQLELLDVLNKDLLLKLESLRSSQNNLRSLGIDYSRSTTRRLSYPRELGFLCKFLCSFQNSEKEIFVTQETSRMCRMDLFLPIYRYSGDLAL